MRMWTLRDCRRVALDTAFAFVAIVGLVGLFVVTGFYDDRLAMVWLVGSFGASITLLLACPDSPLGRAYPALMGNGVAAVIGVACQVMLGGQPTLAAVAAITLAVLAMSALRAWHPPGGATALLAVVGGPVIHRLGWLYPLLPILLGTAYLLVLARGRARLGQRLAIDPPPAAR